VLAICRDGGLRRRLTETALMRTGRDHAPRRVLGAYRSAYEVALDRAAA